MGHLLIIIQNYYQNGTMIKIQFNHIILQKILPNEYGGSVKLAYIVGKLRYCTEQEEKWDAQLVQIKLQQ